LILASGYFSFRGIRREIAIARLQSEFVSAVSHEFRTPLTSIRQLSHMLHGGRVGSDERRAQYYAVLVRESERLNRLVERMLGFGRADAGKFRLEPLDARDLARAVVADFTGQASNRVIDVDLSSSACPLRADREMLSLAFWNLLDNAVKYSPDGRPVRVHVEPRDGRVAIADLPGVKFGFMSMHPDSKRIAYLAGEDEEEVWVLENLPAASDNAGSGEAVEARPRPLGGGARCRPGLGSTHPVTPRFPRALSGSRAVPGSPGGPLRPGLRPAGARRRGPPRVLQGHRPSPLNFGRDPHSAQSKPAGNPIASKGSMRAVTSPVSARATALAGTYNVV
jgi:hypothetical protein